MLDARSPLAALQPFAGQGISIAEAGGFALTQVAGDEKALRKALGKLPAKVGVAAKSGEATLFRVAPRQVWLLDGEVEEAAGLYLTPLSSSRTRIAVEGELSRNVMSAVVPVDFHPTVFKPGHVAMTGIHHTPVTVHCVGNNVFHIYAMRTFAVSVWEFVVDAAVGVLKQH